MGRISSRGSFGHLLSLKARSKAGPALSMRSIARHHLISGSADCSRDPNRAFWRLQAQGRRDPSVRRWSTQAGLRSHDGLGCGGELAGGAAGSPLRFEDGAVGHDAALDVAPQGDEQLAGECDDHGALEASGGDADAGMEPACEGSVGLAAEPEPGELDGGMPGSSVAGLADALLAMGGAAGEGGRVEAAIGGELATIA